jgi:hypothetical protein
MLKHPVKGTKLYMAARNRRRNLGRTSAALGALLLVPVGLAITARARSR